MTDHQLAQQRSRVFSRLFTTLFVLYTIALVTGTHWPQPDIPSSLSVSDKALHVSAYLLWGLLLLSTGLAGSGLRAVLMVLLVGGAFAATDEITQQLPGVNRSAESLDFLADLLGLSIALGIWSVWIRIRSKARSRLKIESPVSVKVS